MNNHFHMQHEHTPQNVAQPYLQQQQPPLTAPTPIPTPAPTYSYLPQQHQHVQQPQWMTYQILPSTQGIAPCGPTNRPKRYYATTTQPTHPRTIQINNSYGQQNPPTKQQAASSSTSNSNPFNANNIRIISTAPSVYSLNKSSPVQSYYLTPRQAGAPTSTKQLNQGLVTGKHLPPLPREQVVHSSHNQPPAVYDRINICINNHYADAASTNLTTSLGTAQQPSPIIPAIQHKAQSILSLIDSSTADSSSSSSSSVSSSSSGGGTTTTVAVIVIDEPDSTTTTPQTPPTTPETMSSPGKSSPSPPPPPTSTPIPIPIPIPTLLKVSSQMKPSFKSTNSAPPTPPTPSPPAISYSLQEDVFVKCDDGRLYLGTIVGKKPDQFLIRFDDRSEQWHELDKLRKLGAGSSGGDGGAGSGSDYSNASVSGPMCVACKRLDQQDVVEICERCGRGYHRGCTTEIAHGSGIWSCKRCAKPMKMQQPLNYETAKKPPGICRQLPYHADKLSWDEKHRVNEEQIYCYCGKPGKFNHNMLQCCKCQNWFHTQCMQNFKEKLLRGDTFFVFCCTVCNDGVEYVRRIQIDWVDMLHIALYNLRKHHNQKYHHLLDILPFVLEQRHKLPIAEQWKTLPETALMERIKQTLKDHTGRFVCGREFKRDPSFFALRHSGPPVTPKVWLQPHEEVCDAVLVNRFNILLMPGKESESGSKDVYEFRTDEEEAANTSEDEIPIKQIIEKAKKKANKTPEEQELQQKHLDKVDTLDLADDNANDGDHGKLPAPIQPQPNAKSSRKRKAFHLSRRYDSSRNHCDLSSDENSSSSRGTSSLDLIIPPPVNFRGRNNPFLMATPKKSSQGKSSLAFGLGTGTGIGVDGVINRIFKLKGGGMDQPRVVRTIKRRLSAKDITIGPNQEVRRRRNRRMTTVEIINTTTINPLSSPYFPLYAKDSLPPPEKPTHGRLLRQRPQKSARSSPIESRRNSNSSTATSGSSSAGNGHSILDLKKSVNKYFGGAMNRIDSGEPFAIRAKRRTGNGQVQYLVEWGGDAATTTNGV
ncbi:GL11547 [Drosophila persimilis]|uniref:GL11547 n=1 Tax=Drosophila persimilis TaxID=7234 RepID=B4GBH4_DROPE|nr:polycomb protein Pcl [Drosophila persimilis]EDW32276.1 GL11547 [Drosophila persimilis]